MSSIRQEARRRGIRMAAQVAAITGFVAAGTAFSQAAEPPKVPQIQGDDGASASEESGTASPADRAADVLRVRNAGCGCTPCWGPPAPPAMRPELFDDIADLAPELLS